MVRTPMIQASVRLRACPNQHIDPLRTLPPAGLLRLSQFQCEFSIYRDMIDDIAGAIEQLNRTS
jgi:hypothetical protein